MTIAERIARHNRHVAEELARAEAGEVICLSDLMAERDDIAVALIEQEADSATPVECF